MFQLGIGSGLGAIGIYTQVLLVICVIFLMIHRKEQIAGVRNWPILGMLPDLLKNTQIIHDFVTDILSKNGGTFEFKGPCFANLDFMVTSNPMNVHHILTGNFINYPKGPEFNRIFEVLGDGIFNADTDLWKSQRKFMQSFVKHDKFLQFLETSLREKVMKGLTSVLDHVAGFGIEVDLQDVFQRFTFDMTCLMVLGFDPVCLSERFPDVSCLKAFDTIEECLLYRHTIPEFFWQLLRRLQIGKEKNLLDAKETMDTFLYSCISKKQEEGRRRISSTQKEEEHNFDMLTAYMEEEDKYYYSCSVKQSNKYLRDIALNLLIAGKDTIGVALTWFFWLITKNPLAETKILDEIKENLVGEDGKMMEFGFDNLKKLVYLEAALRETIRLYPPVPINHRNAIMADEFPSGQKLKANSRVLLSFFSMGRMEEIWGEDCLEFKPERWISGRGDIAHVPSYKFVGFNAGPRSCVGKNLSFQEMKTVASAMIWNYQVQVVEGHPVQPCPSILLHMKYGLKVKISKRGIAGSVNA